MISLVIPVYNERESLAELHGEICAVARRYLLDVEVLLVDDGSRDGSWRVIQELADRDDRVRGIRLRRNFGKAAALSAGFQACRGDIVFTLDADLQDDPAEVPFFLNTLRGGFDVVSGWKRTRHDPWHKVWPSRVFNRLIGWLTGVRLHDHNCGMKCYRAEVVRELRLYGEMHRFIPVLAAARGFQVGEMEVLHRPRKHGHSKYGVRRLVKGLLDLLTVKFLSDFGRRPQHLLGSIGLTCMLVALLGLTYFGVTAVWQLIAPDAPAGGLPVLIGSVTALVLGTQALLAGLLAERLVATDEAREKGYAIGAETSPLRAPPPVAPSRAEGARANGLAHSAH
jgi:dolichol-phosphate mannosyltransferase